MVEILTLQDNQALFDFGFSEHGAAFNADALNVDLSNVESLVLSHGHIDHLGGLKQLPYIEKEMGAEFLLIIVGTKLTFSA